MEWTEKLIASVILAGGMIITGDILRKGIISYKEMDRTVTVKGLAEREVKADKVTWPLVFKEIGNNPNEMYTLLEEKNHKVVDFLLSAGIGKEEINVNPPIITDRQADSYNNEIMNYRYKATSIITVTSKDVDKVRQLILRQSELMKQGIPIIQEEYNTNNQIVYEFTGLNEIKPSMVEEATKNARETAKKFAEDSESDLGDIRKAQQGQFTITDRDSNTPYIKQVRVVTTVEYALE